MSAAIEVLEIRQLDTDSVLQAFARARLGCITTATLLRLCPTDPRAT
jgi:hypothetical protein